MKRDGDEKRGRGEKRERDTLPETLPCVLSRRSRVCRQNARVTKDTVTQERFESTHGSVFNVHTALFSVQEPRRETTRSGTKCAHTHSTSRYNHNNTQHHATTRNNKTLPLSLRRERQERETSLR